jgi:antitoxin component of RelBE/YafQ-DinJ toxin-antitoxin module
MALKTFNIDDAVYKNYSKHCKKKGISMSRQVEIFLRNEVEKIADVGLKDNIDVKKIEKDMKSFDKSLEHPLKKYC